MRNIPKGDPETETVLFCASDENPQSAGKFPVLIWEEKKKHKRVLTIFLIKVFILFGQKKMYGVQLRRLKIKYYHVQFVCAYIVYDGVFEWLDYGRSNEKYDCNMGIYAYIKYTTIGGSRLSDGA